MFEGFKVLFVEDDPPVRASLVQTLELAGLLVQEFNCAEDVLPFIYPDDKTILISDVRLPGMDGMSLLQRAREIDAELPVIVITAHGDVSMAVQAMRLGAYDFLEKPFSPERFVETAGRALEHRMLRHTVRDLRTQLQARDGIEAAMLGDSPAMAEIRRKILRLADTSADVMILGETGTGKELAARCLHDHGSRRDRQFVAINCGGMPEHLIESELFGHEAGAFTSASKRRIGKLEHANGGTLFLDEIESMPMSMQIKLLRVLQERKVARLGSNVEQPINVRVIAATKSDLLELSESQQFRADLYYRLNVAVLRLPPLRERKQDIPLLFEYFVAESGRRYGTKPPEVTTSHLGALMSHDWPGNVREIRNAADRFVLGMSDVGFDPFLDVQMPLSKQMDLVEKTLLEQAMRRHQGRIQHVMNALGIPKKTLYDKLHKHGIDPERFRQIEPPNQRYARGSDESVG